jgi:hypothetical protein
MPDEEKSPFGILPKITTRGDIGAAGLGLAIGYFADAALHPFGIPPAQASLYCAAAAVGVKNVIQSMHEFRKNDKAKPTAGIDKRQRLEAGAEELIRIANRYAKETPGRDLENARHGIERSLSLFRLGIIDANEMQASLTEIVNNDVVLAALRKQTHADATGASGGAGQ